LVFVEPKRPLERVAGGGETFGASQITLEDGLGSAAGDALISGSWFRPGQARRRHIVQGWAPPPEQFVPTPDTAMLDCILGISNGMTTLLPIWSLQTAKPGWCYTQRRVRDKDT
jgi:hypothetical protein